MRSPTFGTPALQGLRRQEYCCNDVTFGTPARPPAVSLFARKLSIQNTCLSTYILSKIKALYLDVSLMNRIGEKLFRDAQNCDLTFERMLNGHQSITIWN